MEEEGQRRKRLGRENKEENPDRTIEQIRKERVKSERWERKEIRRAIRRKRKE